VPANKFFTKNTELLYELKQEPNYTAVIGKEPKYRLLSF